MNTWEEKLTAAVKRYISTDKILRANPLSWSSCHPDLDTDEGLTYWCQSNNFQSASAKLWMVTDCEYDDKDPLRAAVDTNCPDCAWCGATYRACGGIVAVVPVYTNLLDGTSIVLPVGVKMCDEATNNPLWYVPFDFGPKVRVLPRVNVDVSPGYIYYGPPVDGQPDYTYSSKFPILIEATTNLCSPCTNEWTTNFYMCFYARRSQEDVGPCQVSNTENHMGAVDAILYSGSNTNGLDMWTGSDWVTNSLMSRFGLGACDNRYDDFNSRSAVAFVYFNLPPREKPNYFCQPGTNFLQYPYENYWCGYPSNYPAGFGYSAANYDSPQNWSNYPAPCDTNLYAERLFRAHCYGNVNCQPEVGLSPRKRSLTK